MKKTKFMMSLDSEIIRELKSFNQGMILQELIRARIIPDWLTKVQILARREYKRGYRAGRKNRVSSPAA